MFQVTIPARALRAALPFVARETGRYAFDGLQVSFTGAGARVCGPQVGGTCFECGAAMDPSANDAKP